MYRLRYTPEARRDLARVPAKVRPALFELIDAIAANPQRLGRPLRLELEGLHRAVRGGYRVVYRIDDEAGVVTIHRAAHRRDVYRPR